MTIASAIGDEECRYGMSIVKEEPSSFIELSQALKRTISLLARPNPVYIRSSDRPLAHVLPFNTESQSHGDVKTPRKRTVPVALSRIMNRKG